MLSQTLNAFTYAARQQLPSMTLRNLSYASCLAKIKNLEPFSKTIYFEENRVGVFAVNDLETRNALSEPILLSLLYQLKQLYSNQSINALILTGSKGSFISGANIREITNATVQKKRELIRIGQNITSLLEESPFATLAAINKNAFGGGLEMACACNIRICSKSANFAMPEIKLGLMPAFRGTELLPRLVGLDHALRLMLTGEPISSEEALRIGLVSRVVEGDPLQDCLEIANKISASSLHCVKAIKKAIYAPLPEQTLRLEEEGFVHCSSTVESAKAIEAFFSRKKE